MDASSSPTASPRAASATHPRRTARGFVVSVALALTVLIALVKPSVVLPLVIAATTTSLLARRRE